MSYAIPPEAIIHRLETENAKLRETLALRDQYLSTQASAIFELTKALMRVIAYGDRTGDGELLAVVDNRERMNEG